jgi:phosphatidylglycerol:prolipoprotein diacylglycerol transferase
MSWENGHLVVPAMSHAVAFALGPVAVHWYPLAYLAGFVLGWWLFHRMLRAPAPPLSPAQLSDLFTWIVAGVILGGRIGFVLFYDLGHYLAQPLDALEIWNGGMSFHGGALGVVAAIFLFARRHRLSDLRILDYAAVVEPVGQGLGRIANFLNGELWGAPTHLSWGVIFRGADTVDTPRHPSQLYEAFLEGAVLFAILHLLFWNSDAGRRPGLLAGAFMAGYGLIRFGLEFVREPDAQLVGLTGPLHMGQWLSLPMIAVGIWLIVRARRRPAVP